MHICRVARLQIPSLYKTFMQIIVDSVADSFHSFHELSVEQLLIYRK